MRICAATAAVILLVPAVEVVAVMRWDPPITGTRLQRRLEARLAGRGLVEHIGDRRLEETPRYLIRCVVVSEDARFLQHSGFDWRELRAALEERGGRGGSTITMQCARTIFLWQGRSWIRKGFEAYYTLWMELLLSKERILELYLNAVETGPGVYGMDAASRFWFRRPLEALGSDQQLSLAAMLPAPSRWDPTNPSGKLEWRRQLIRRREPGLRFPDWGSGSGRAGQAR